MDFLKKLGIPDYEFRLVFGRTRIDYDPTKEAINLQKHGYSLRVAVQLLERVLLPIKTTPFATSDAFKERGEVRHMHMGLDSDGNVVFVVTTMRTNETVRVISLRRASKKEKHLFHQLTGYRQSDE